MGMISFLSNVALRIVETVEIVFASKRCGTSPLPLKLEFQRLVESKREISFSLIARPGFYYRSLPYSSYPFRLFLFFFRHCDMFARNNRTEFGTRIHGRSIEWCCSGPHSSYSTRCCFFAFCSNDSRSVTFREGSNHGRPCHPFYQS